MTLREIFIFLAGCGFALLPFAYRAWMTDPARQRSREAARVKQNQWKRMAVHPRRKELLKVFLEAMGRMGPEGENYSREAVARTDFRLPVDPWSPAATCFCLSAALVRSVYPEQLREETPDIEKNAQGELYSASLGTVYALMPTKYLSVEDFEHMASFEEIRKVIQKAVKAWEQ